MLRFLNIAFLTMLLCGLSAFAQTKKVFIVGIGKYEHLPSLERTIGDAEGYSDVFKNNLDFEVIRLLDPTKDEFEIAFASFIDGIQPNDQIAFIFSGHGWSDGGDNYLIFKDAPLSGSESLFRLKTIALSKYVMDEIRRKRPSLTFAVIDACRNNPFDMRTKSVQRGFVPMQKQRGEMIVHSAGAYQTALDRLSQNDTSKYSVFSRVLLEKLKDKERSLFEIVDDTKIEVEQMAKVHENHEQRPAIYMDIDRHFCFAGVGNCKSTGLDQESRDYKNANSCADYTQFLKKYPNGKFQTQAVRSRNQVCEKEADDSVSALCSSHQQRLSSLSDTATIVEIRSAFKSVPDTCASVRAAFQKRVQQKECANLNDELDKLSGSSSVQLFQTFLQSVPQSCSVARIRATTMINVLSRQKSNSVVDACDGPRKTWELVRQQNSASSIEAFKASVTDKCPILENLADVRLTEIRNSPVAVLPVCTRAASDWNLISGSTDIPSLEAFKASVSQCPKVSQAANARVQTLNCSAAAAKWGQVKSNGLPSVLKASISETPTYCATLLTEMQSTLKIAEARVRASKSEVNWKNLTLAQSTVTEKLCNFGGCSDVVSATLSSDGHYLALIRMKAGNAEHSNIIIHTTKNLKTKYAMSWRHPDYKYSTNDVPLFGLRGIHDIISFNGIEGPVFTAEPYLKEEPGVFQFKFAGSRGYPSNSLGNRISRLETIPLSTLRAPLYHSHDKLISVGHDPNLAFNSDAYIWYSGRNKSPLNLKLADKSYQQAASFDAKGDSFGLVTTKGQAFVINASNVAQRVELKDAKKVLNINLSPNGLYAAGTYKKDVFIWNAVTGELIKTIEFDNKVSGAIFAADGKSLFTIEQTGELKEWLAH